MGRRNLGMEEDIRLSLPPGTRDRIDAVLTDKEPRQAFIRVAIDREVLRRQKARGASNDDSETIRILKAEAAVKDGTIRDLNNEIARIRGVIGKIAEKV